jgi:hypothetical protein
MTFIGANILVRYLTGLAPDQADTAARFRQCVTALVNFLLHTAVEDHAGAGDEGSPFRGKIDR